MNWFIWFLIIWLCGYLLNRLVFWFGAILWSWCENIWFLDQYWYNADTTIQDVIYSIKYRHPDSISKYFHDYTDSYETATFYRWVPILNITGIIIGLLMIVGFILTILWLIIRFILICIVTIIIRLWKLCLHYIWDYIVKICKIIIHSSLINFIFNFIHNLKNKILNTKIS